MPRQVQAGGGYLTQSSWTVHFGPGDNPAIDRVEITWSSGTFQELKGIDASKLHPLLEQRPTR